MSVESLAIALHHSRAGGAAKLVLIGIANHDGDGGAWPTVATLAKYAHVTPRNVQKALTELERLGEIRRYVSAGGDHSTADNMRPNLYKFLLQCPHTCDRTSRHRVRGEAVVFELLTGVSDATPGVASDTRGVSVATGGGVSVATPKPSLEPSLNQQARFKEETRVTAHEAPTAPDAELYASLIAAKCPNRSGRNHRPEPSGYCRDCGARTAA